MKSLISALALVSVGALALEEGNNVEQIVNNLETSLFGSVELSQLAVYAESVVDHLSSNNHLSKSHQSPQDVIPVGESCLECTCKAAFAELEMAFDFVRAECLAHRPAPGPWWYICHWVEKEPEEVKGYLDSKMHPVLSGFTYCAGHGECTLGDLVNMRDDCANTSFSMTAIKQCLAYYHSTDVSDQVSDEKRAAIAFRVNGFIQSLHHSSVGRHHHDHRPTRECRNCLKITMRHIIRMAEAHVCRECHEHEHCPVARALCTFMKEHPHFAKGWLIGMVEPWKFSMGFCLGKGVCGRHENGMSDREEEEMFHYHHFEHHHEHSFPPPPPPPPHFDHHHGHEFPPPPPPHFDHHHGHEFPPPPHHAHHHHEGPMGFLERHPAVFEELKAEVAVDVAAAADKVVELVQ